MFKIKRIYKKPNKSDELRILVDRLWPRGLSKEDAKIDYWMKDIAPSDNLRKWFAHRQERWQEFRSCYFKELRSKKVLLKQLTKMSKGAPVTLLYAAKDKAKNNAVALEKFIKNNELDISASNR